MGTVAQLNFDGRLPPDPVNQFQSSIPNTEGGFDIGHSSSKPGALVQGSTIVYANLWHLPCFPIVPRSTA
ncbi:MAG TPA: hypothetical protein DG761_03445 [Gammaproteobacteria bacterium]|nr:hypothetical protein [Gammaproteobacteria bacterium]